MKRLLALFVLCLPLAALGQVTAKFTLAWNANTESDMQSYRVYQALGTSGEWKLVATVEHPITEVTILSSAAGLHRFHVTAVNQAGLESGPSNEVQGTPPTVPGAVTTLKLKALVVEQTTTIPVP